MEKFNRNFSYFIHEKNILEFYYRKGGYIMNFEIKKTKNKTETINKSLYISKALAERIQRIAIENGTSFNNIVVSMIESCLKEDTE
jgi:hypothetical protein